MILTDIKSKIRRFLGGSVVYHLLILFISIPLCLCMINATAFTGAWEELAGSATGGGVSNNADNSNAPSLALYMGENPHIAWWDSSGGNDEIYYAYWDGTNWVGLNNSNTGGGVSNNAGDSNAPSLALDMDGNPHIAWWDFSGGDLRYTTAIGIH